MHTAPDREHCSPIVGFFLYTDLVFRFQESAVAAVAAKQVNVSVQYHRGLVSNSGPPNFRSIHLGLGLGLGSVRVSVVLV